ncbi:MAG: GNAT family N-acetyltransferase [Roseovarius sp.]|nr:GNAT family N-acetyltransferase [Roseovarius sp.]
MPRCAARATPAGVAAVTLALDIPRLETARLILRAPEPADFDPLCAFLTDPERSWGFGTEKDRPTAWRWFALNIGHWALRGYGYFTMELRETGRPCGISGIWAPEGWPEPELGWALFEGFEGKGLAAEGAQRVRAWAYRDLGFTTLTSNIVPGNERSVTLAERLGARFERTYDNVHMGEDMLFRHPGPDELGLGCDDAGGNPGARA